MQNSWPNTSSLIAEKGEELLRSVSVLNFGKVNDTAQDTMDVSL